MSRGLTQVEKRYSQCEKEALALVWSCERLELYLLGRRFTLITDNRAVQLIYSKFRFQATSPDRPMGIKNHEI